MSVLGQGAPLPPPSGVVLALARQVVPLGESAFELGPQDGGGASEIDTKPSSGLDDSGSGSEDGALHSAQSPSGRRGGFHLAADDVDEVEGERRKSETDLVFGERRRGKTRPNGFEQLADAILEGSPSSVMEDEILGRIPFLRPGGHEEEVARQEFELTGLRIGLVDDAQDDSLPVLRKRSANPMVAEGSSRCTSVGSVAGRLS